MRIRGLDDWGWECSKLALVAGDTVVAEVLLADYEYGMPISLTTDADLLRFMGSEDGTCPWADYRLMNADPNGIEIREIVTLEFEPIVSARTEEPYYSPAPQP